MKVCTDACLFGAWLAENLEQHSFQSALDIGTGTGLLPLIVRQKNDIAFDCVEINKATAKEAESNFNQSPWPQAFSVYYVAIQQYVISKKYDLIISNPPFYGNDLKSADIKRNDALHSTSLQLEELFFYAESLLNESGCFVVMLPYHRLQYVIKLATDFNFYLHQQVNIQQSFKHSFFRTFLWFSRKETITSFSTVSIKDDKNNYTEDFIHLLKDYYLYL